MVTYNLISTGSEDTNASVNPSLGTHFHVSTFHVSATKASSAAAPDGLHLNELERHFHMP